MNRLGILGERLRCRVLRTCGIQSMRNLGNIVLPFDLCSHSAYNFARYDSYDIPLMVLMREVLHEGGVFVDVGANIGYSAAVGMHRVGRSGRVIAFEPVPTYSVQLSALAKANPGHHLLVEPVALGSQAGETAIAVSERNIGWNTMVPGFMREPHAVVRIPVLVFDDYVKTHELNRIDLIKIDVEGYELPVLEGMRATLLRLRPPLHVECAPQAYRLLDRQASDLQAFLADVGYRARDAQSLRPVDLATIQQTTNVLLTPLDR